MRSGPLRLGDIVARLGGELLGDPDVEVSTVGTLRAAGPGAISFLSQSRFRADLAATRASALIVAPDARAASSLPRIVCKDPYAYFARVSALLNPTPAVTPGIHPSAVVAPDARIAPTAHVGAGCVIGAQASVGDGAAVGAACVIGEGASVGAHARLHPRVTLYGGCEIGERSIVHSGAVIGADGFGFANEDG